MAESRALSQSEIDALLNQIPAGSEPEAAADGEDVAEDSAPPPPQPDRGFARAIKTYDFRRPDKFSREQWQTLQTMHDTYARLIGAAFSSRLRTLVAARLSSIDQGLYEEWQSQVPAQTVCYVFSLAPLSGNIVVEFNVDIAREVVDRLLGGTGLLIDRSRELADLEIVLLRSFASTVATSIEEMWGNIVGVEAELADIGLDASLIQIAGQNDVVITAFFEINIGDRLGAMSICTPYTLIEPLAGSLSAQVWQSQRGGQPDPRFRRLMEALLADAPLEVGVELGAAMVPAREVAALQEGDTLILDSRVNRSLPLLVGGHERFLCRPGVIGNQVGVTVTEVVDRPPLLDFEVGSQAGGAAQPVTAAGEGDAPPPDDAAQPPVGAASAADIASLIEQGAPAPPPLTMPAEVAPTAGVVAIVEEPANG